jgi:hypothetical protein
MMQKNQLTFKGKMNAYKRKQAMTKKGGMCLDVDSNLKEKIKRMPKKEMKF